MTLFFELQPRKILKKLPENRRRLALEALYEVERNPYQGDPKKGDLAGVLTYRFKMFEELWLIAYEFIGPQELRIIKIGVRENFYGDLN